MSEAGFGCSAGARDGMVQPQGRGRPRGALRSTGGKASAMASGLGVLALLVHAAMLVAQPTPDLLPASPSAELADRFRAADFDRSGALSRDEAGRGGFAINERFDAIDRDGSGTVTLVELGGYVASAAQEWWTGVSAADVDRDGRVSEQEAAAVPSLARVFRAADRNQDNVLSAEEYRAFSERRLYQNVDLPSVAPNIIEKRF